MGLNHSDNRAFIVWAVNSNSLQTINNNSKAIEIAGVCSGLYIPATEEVSTKNKCLRQDNAPWLVTCLKWFFPSWGRANHSVEQSSYEIIFFELGTIQKIPLAGWRLFYFHQQIHVHVTRPHDVMSYCILSCNIMSCLRHVFRFYIMWNACWFLPLWSRVVHTSWCKMHWIHLPVSRKGGGQNGSDPPLGDQHFWNHLQRFFRHLTELLASRPPHS